MAAAVASVLTDRLVLVLFWCHRDVLGQVFFRIFQPWIPQSYLGIRGSVWAKSKLIMLFTTWNRPSSKRRKGRTVESAAASQKLSSCCSGTTLLHRRLFVCLLLPHFKGATHKILFVLLCCSLFTGRAGSCQCLWISSSMAVRLLAPFNNVQITVNGHRSMLLLA